MVSTIIDLKKSFLMTQIRILNTPLEAPPQWRDNAPRPTSEHGDLKEKVVQEAIHKLNIFLRHHNRTLYSAQITRHVAEQIDHLYWSSYSSSPASSSLENPATPNPNTLLPSQTLDLHSPTSLSHLPSEWPPSPSQPSSQPSSPLLQNPHATYTRLLTRLQTLHTTLTTKRDQIAQYTHLLSLIEPFRDPVRNVQPNLVTRGGELEREFERMRVLVARLRGKIGERGKGGGRGLVVK